MYVPVLSFELSQQETSTQADSENNMKMKEPMKIIHKEQDIITAFALNQVLFILLKFSVIVMI